MTPREYRALVDRRTEEFKRDDFRFGTLMALVATVAGSKKENGTKFLASDFFPSLAPPPVSLDTARAARISRGLGAQGEDQVTAGWERWALMCRQISARRSQGQVGAASA